MQPSGNARTGYMLGVLTLAFLVVAGTVVTVAMMFTAPAAGGLLFFKPGNRDFMFWFALGFVTFLEMLAYMSLAGTLLGRMKAVRVSPMTRAANRRLMAVYGILGLVMIGVYSARRSTDGNWDIKFSILFGLLTALAFVGAFLLRAWDIYSQSGGQAEGATVNRQAHVAKARTLQPIINEIRSISGVESPILTRIDRLCKKLDTVEQALTHSHGGGLGSIEQGFAHKLDPAAAAQVDELTKQLQGVAFGLQGKTDMDRQLDQADRIAVQLEGCVTAMDLA